MLFCARQMEIVTHRALVGAKKYCATTESAAKARKKANSRVWTFTQSTRPLIMDNDYRLTVCFSDL